jgi:hypothetical protein
MLKMVNVDYVTPGQWCDQGDFAEKALEELRESPTFVGMVPQMLKPIEENRDALSGPLQRGNLTYDTSATQEKWLIQAKGCAMARPDTDFHRLKKQKTYFALGMIAFQMRPCAEYLWVDKTLDIWYDMGFGVVFDPDGPKYLQDMYESFFRNDFGILLFLSRCSMINTGNSRLL